jgi:hypothetical protein
MTRENKLALRRELEENVQESYEESDDAIGEMVEWLFDDGLEKEEVMNIATKVRGDYNKQIVQLYSN